jgi:hypothetical protein
MTRTANIAVLLTGAAMLAACAPAGPRGLDIRGRQLPPIADPGKVVATEIAMGHMAREEGMYKATAYFAAEDAVMFVPDPVLAQEWLKDRSDPEYPISWKTHQVWSSCNGSHAVTYGGWEDTSGAVGDSVMVWERQQEGEYRWILDYGNVRETALEAPEMVRTAVADCSETPTPVVMSGANDLTDRRKGASQDYSLYWQVDTHADGRRDVDVYLWRNGARERVFESSSEIAGE